MNHEPIKGLISVIIPVFNAEKYLSAAVKSVLAQSYTDWELILVEDGSSDRSPEIAKEFAASDQRIRYFEHAGRRNLGMCSTRNVGVRHCRGEFVALLDADDLWLPDKLQEQFALMSANPDAALVFGDSIYIDENGSPIDGASSFPAAGLYRPPELLKLCYPLGPASSACPSSFFMRRELLNQTGGFDQAFDHFALYEDQVFLAKVYLHANVLVSNSRWDMYRYHPESYTGRAKREGSDVKMRLAYLNWLSGYLRDRHFDDAAIWQRLRQQLLPFRYPRLASMKRTLMQAIAKLSR